MLLASSANIYGNCGQSPIAETQPPAPVNHYAMSKLAMEHMARDLPAPTSPGDRAALQLHGPGQAPQFVIPKLVDHFRAAGRQASPWATCMSSASTTTCASSAKHICGYWGRDKRVQVYNICTGRTYDFRTVIATLQQLTGHQPLVEVDPNLVRANEVHRLCGDASHLRAAVGELPTYTLEQTLAWMLASPA